MAPLPQNNTHRMFFDYVTGTQLVSREHTCAVRYNPSLRDVGDVQADFLALLQAFGAANFTVNWRVFRVRVQAAGTNFSLPITVIASLAAFVGSNAAAPAAGAEAIEDTFQGRSFTSGRRVDLSLYRAQPLVTSNFRVNPGAGGINLVVQNAVAVLNARSQLGSFITIDGTPGTYAAYMNQNFNSYWESRSRTT